MILQANSVGGVTDDETGLIYEIVRLAAVIEVTTYLHPYAPQPLPSVHPFGPDHYPKIRPTCQSIISAAKGWISNFNTSPVAGTTRMDAGHNLTPVRLGSEYLWCLG